MKYNYKLFEDNAGGLHLAVMDGETCVYYLCDNDHNLVMSTLDELKRGSDPLEDEWEGGEPNPDECYQSIVSIVDERNGGAWDVECGEIAKQDCDVLSTAEMDKTQQLFAAIELQKKFAELYKMDVLLGVQDNYLQIRYQVFCELFPDGPDYSERQEKYIHHHKTFNGVNVVALEDVRECEN